MNQCSAGYSSSRLTYWILGALFSVLVLIAGGAWATLGNRVDDLEEGRNINAMGIHDLTRDVRAMQADVCIILQQTYDIQEFIEKRRVFRRPCP